MSIIKTEHLTKRFKDVRAVYDLNLTIEESECFGLLGPNGAGKTTLIKLITAISSPSEGKVWVAGKDVAEYSRETKAYLGVVPQKDNLDEDLNVMQNLTTFARYFSIQKDEARRRSSELLEIVKLDDKREARIKELSGGMRRRLLIARGLINNPRLLILDEPSVGLDPQARHLIWQKLGELKSRGITQLLCTQSMEEATILCDRVAIMNHGEIVAQNTPRNLIREYAGDEVTEIEPGQEIRQTVVQELVTGRLKFIDMGDRIRVFHSNGMLPDVFNGLPVRVKSSLSTLEDVFFILTGEELG